MSEEYFIIELYCRVDLVLGRVKKHPQAKLYPSEVVTLGLLFALKGCGQRAYWRWLTRNYGGLFPHLPLDRNRLFRLFNSHRHLTQLFLADPSLLGVIDSYGIELLHPVREGRNPNQLGKKGLSNHRWIVGGKLCLVLNHLGLVVNWACDTANVYDGSAFQALVDDLADQMVILADQGFRKKDWQPTNLKICRRGEWNERMLVETVFSMLTYVCDFKHSRHKLWAYFETKLAFTMALFNLLVQWDGLHPDDHGFVALSIANFSL